LWLYVVKFWKRMHKFTATTTYGTRVILQNIRKNCWMTWLFLTLILMNSFARRQVFKKITFERCKTALTAQIWKWEILLGWKGPETFEDFKRNIIFEKIAQMNIVSTTFCKITSLCVFGWQWSTDTQGSVLFWVKLDAGRASISRTAASYVLSNLGGWHNDCFKRFLKAHPTQ